MANFNYISEDSILSRIESGKITLSTFLRCYVLEHLEDTLIRHNFQIEDSFSELKVKKIVANICNDFYFNSCVVGIDFKNYLSKDNHTALDDKIVAGLICLALSETPDYSICYHSLLIQDIPSEDKDGEAGGGLRVHSLNEWGNPDLIDDEDDDL